MPSLARLPPRKALRRCNAMLARGSAQSLPSVDMCTSRTLRCSCTNVRYLRAQELEQFLQWPYRSRRVIVLLQNKGLGEGCASGSLVHACGQAPGLQLSLHISRPVESQHNHNQPFLRRAICNQFIILCSLPYCAIAQLPPRFGVELLPQRRDKTSFNSYMLSFCLTSSDYF